MGITRVIRGVGYYNESIVHYNMAACPERPLSSNPIYLQLNVPLPDCAPGEWGPTKAVKLLGLVPLSHLYPVINAAPDENVVLKGRSNNNYICKN